MTWDGFVTKYHKSYLKSLQIPQNVITYIQSIVLKKTVESIPFDRRRGLESDRMPKKAGKVRTTAPLKQASNEK
ncbi:hypothetical protein CWI38_1737p0010 [Hamiltosporidium tvaerminnensis]|uniref:Uncharacterized protein n=1 Tax=Hamiltosporidium tvaerminnensis TaxID=1176355 RepID=A0A4Q9LQ42_9MICR|nr:hypothetical protein CWI38_1737p0010 [Hamiltosporidium tvaerminnensis]